MPPGSDRKFIPIRIAILTVSDSRVEADDRSGDLLAQRIASTGHILSGRRIVPDQIDAIVAVLHEWIADATADVIISTGGTGITGRDVTPEAFRQVLEKDLPGFGELFRMLCYETIATSTMLSRALAGVSGGLYLFALPGSPSAVADAWDKILVHQLDSRTLPGNLVNLLPRLRER